VLENIEEIAADVVKKIHGSFLSKALPSKGKRIVGSRAIGGLLNRVIKVVW